MIMLTLGDSRLVSFTCFPCPIFTIKQKLKVTAGMGKCERLLKNTSFIYQDSLMWAALILMSCWYTKYYLDIDSNW